MKKLTFVIIMIILLLAAQGCVQSDFNRLWDYMQANGIRNTEGGQISYSIEYPADENETVSVLISVSQDRNIRLALIANNRPYEEGLALIFDYWLFDSTLSLVYYYSSTFVNGVGYDSSPIINSFNGTLIVIFDRYQGNNRSRHEANAEQAANNLIEYTKYVFEARIGVPFK